MARVAIIDYGMGNLRSVQKAFEYLGIAADITDDADVLKRADGAVLPGVGAFRDCISQLTDTGLVPHIADFVGSGRPFLGICLGLQLLFDGSDEGWSHRSGAARPCVLGGDYAGLGLLPGRVVELPHDHKIPHMGWNTLHIQQPGPLFQGIQDGDAVYFVHSFHARPADPALLAATTDYGIAVTAAVQRGNLYATQFHPEKSGEVGLHILRNFGGLL